jgi:asparagine synthase (glutamine-hydrolysing)
MFAFVLYDKVNHTLTCCRDRAGVKPFYYYWKDNLFLFSSELKSFLKHPAFEKRLNHEAVRAYFQLGYVPAPMSIYQEAFKLPPAHILEINLITHETRLTQYWNINNYYNQPIINIDFREALDETERIMEKAFNYRMVADVPVGVFLSGGYDSTCVTALLQKNQSRKIKTFTIGMQDQKLDEAPFARRIADRLGTDHHELYCTEQQALDMIPHIPYYYDEPLADDSAIPTMLVSKIARDIVTVALSADGGDEIFGGYNRYATMMSYYEKLKTLPQIPKKIASFIMNWAPLKAFPILYKNNLFQFRYQKIKSVLTGSSVSNIFRVNTLLYLEDEINKMFLQNSDARDLFFNLPSINNTIDLLSYACAADFSNHMVDGILQKVDRATMSVSLEGREPFLDQHIIEWAAKLPPTFKVKNGERKYLLKEIVHKHVEKKLMDRPKMGFASPVDIWLHNVLKPQIDYFCDPNYIERQGIFNLDYVTNMKRCYYQGKHERKERLWSFFMFQLWYEKWMN